MAKIKNFESNEFKLTRMRNEHLKMNEELDFKIKQMELKANNDGSVSEAEIDDILRLMHDMTLDRRKINEQAVKCGKEDMYNNKKTAKIENALDDMFDRYL